MSENLQGAKCRLNKLENIEEDNATDWLPVTCPLPETPTESMEFLARSWSLSAVELSKVLCDMHDAKKLADEPPTCPHNVAPQPDHGSSLLSGVNLLQQNQPLLASPSPSVSPRGSADMKVNYNAQLHAAVSVAGVAAAVAALTASLVTSPEKSGTKHKKSSITSTAIASAAAVVASHSSSD